MRYRVKPSWCPYGICLNAKIYDLQSSVNFSHKDSACSSLVYSRQSCDKTHCTWYMCKLDVNVELCSYSSAADATQHHLRQAVMQTFSCTETENFWRQVEP